MRRLALLVVLALLPACSDKRTPPAPATVPAGAEEAAVNAVLAGLDGVMGDLQRMLVRERRLTEEVVDRLQAIYTGPELLNQIDAFQADLANNLAGYRAVPGNRRSTVSRLITVSPVCVFAEVERDYAPVSGGESPRVRRLYVVLVTKEERDDPRKLNPTPWAMLYDGVQEDGTQPEDVCR